MIKLIRTLNKVELKSLECEVRHSGEEVAYFGLPRLRWCVLVLPPPMLARRPRDRGRHNFMWEKPCTVYVCDRTRSGHVQRDRLMTME